MTAISTRSSAGFALVGVLWLLTAMIGMIGVGTVALRGELAAGQNRILLTRGTWAARACLAIAKDRFTRDMGRVEEAYQEVARRLGILPEGGPRDLKGPALMQ